VSNVSEEIAQHQTDTQELHPDGAKYGFAAVINRRPAWAGQTRIEPEAIVHSWMSPTVVKTIEHDGELYIAPVELVREDMLYVNDQGVVLDPGPDRIFLLDTNLDVANARRLAAAIVECCDRIEAAEVQ
jgi:hypothetical protein